MNNLKYINNFVYAAIFLIIAICGSTWLLLELKIGEKSFIDLIALSLVGFALIAFYKIIDFLKFKDFELEFREVKESERLVKKLSSELVVLAESFKESALFDSSFNEAKFDETISEIKKITG